MPHVPYTTQAVIGWRNVFADGVLTASSETTSGPAENAADGLTWDYWEGDGDTSGDTLTVELVEGALCDYLAIAAHDLGSQGATIELEGSDNGSSWTSVAGPFSPTDDKPWLWRFDGATHAWWRITILGGPTKLGVVNAGELLVLPEGIFVGHKPAPLNRKPETMPNKSERGQFLGRSVIRAGAAVTISQDRVSQTWARTEGVAFRDHAEDRPFFFAWRHATFPEEVIYGQTPEGGSVEITQSQNGFMSFSCDVEGQVQ